MARWSVTSVNQNAALVTGMALGAGLETVNMVSAIGNLGSTIQALSNNPNVVSTLGTAYVQNLSTTYAEYQTALETAGIDGATMAGVKFTELLVSLSAVASVPELAVGAGKTLLTLGNSAASLLGKMDTVAGVGVGGAKNSGIIALADLTPITPSASGGISAAKLNSSSYAITDLTPAEQSMAQQVVMQGDSTGAVTENLVNAVAERQGLTVLDGGKYGSNNGFDHVLQNPDGTVTILMDSKQITNGSTTLSQGAGGAMQLTDSWVKNVLGNIDQTSAAYNAIENAMANGTLVKGVAGVDRTTGQVTIVRVK
jgi:filamentous hemagglutinin